MTENIEHNSSSGFVGSLNSLKITSAIHIGIQCWCCVGGWLLTSVIVSPRKANEGLLALSQEDTMPISMRQLAYGKRPSHASACSAINGRCLFIYVCHWFAVSGLGFGFMSGAFSVVNILSDSLGPGTVGIHGDPQHYFISSGNEMQVCVWTQRIISSLTQMFSVCFFSSAFMTLAIILLHMFWGVVFFEACERQRWWALGAVVISHLIVSCLVSQHTSCRGTKHHQLNTYGIKYLLEVYPEILHF